MEIMNNYIERGELRINIRKNRLVDENIAIDNLAKINICDSDLQKEISKNTAEFIDNIRNTEKPDLLSLFLNEYNLSTEEGLALMTLAETLLRVPDKKTRDQLLSDKLTDKNWEEHSSKSSSSIVNMATIALRAADMLIAKGHSKTIKDKIKHAISIISNPVFRVSTSNVMMFFGNQFVFSQNIEKALKKSRDSKRNLCSFDMLGEAAWTMDDANKYFDSYKNALKLIVKDREKKLDQDIFNAHSISVKLSALHPKYDFMHKQRVMDELLPRVIELVDIAKKGNVGLNIDAEEAERLDLSLDIIEEVMKHIKDNSWKGFGIVVQAYQKRASFVIDWLYEKAKKYNINIMVRLVKGAYWDTEIKNSQVRGDDNYPVFTKKINTDYSYLICSQKLLNMRDFIYPQFASHNAHSLISVCKFAGNNKGFELQRLHGMGEALHKKLCEKYDVKSRIYAPVGVYKDLLAYLVRRLLENGANSSFLNHLFDSSIESKFLGNNVFDEVEKSKIKYNEKIPLPIDIFGKKRKNSKGIKITEQDVMDDLYDNIKPWMNHKWHAKSLLFCENESLEKENVLNPANLSDIVGVYEKSSKDSIQNAIDCAYQEYNKTTKDNISDLLRKAADLYEENRYELICLLIREAGKTYQDAIDEIREAVDFLRYYANLREEVILKEKRESVGVFVCISPWNFPLAIFTGQIAAALAAGNHVIAKPAEDTSIIACRAVEILHKAGISRKLLQLVLGKGSVIGSYLSTNKLVAGIAFTGSTGVAKVLKENLIKSGNGKAKLIAETGGLNAMIVDSTALHEQVARDVVDSAFKSAGQRCSALRILIVQKESATDIKKIVINAMNELTLGDPINLSTDCGPVINKISKERLDNYLKDLKEKGNKVFSLDTNYENGHFVLPSVVELNDINDLKEEFFGPILHIVTYKKNELDNVIDKINTSGYGLTFGVHSRIKSRTSYISKKINAGNIYVNRNQIGAIVGCQPFGGEGLSGTGPKAGGLHSLHGFSNANDDEKLSNTKFEIFTSHVNIIKSPVVSYDKNKFCEKILDSENNFINKIKKVFPFITDEKLDFLQKKVSLYSKKHTMEGVTGESNVLYYLPKGTVLCLGPSMEDKILQAIFSLAFGNSVQGNFDDDDFEKIMALEIEKGYLINLKEEPNLDYLNSSVYNAIFWFGEINSIEKELINRNKEIMPIINSYHDEWRLVKEKVVSIDTTASGGNASLLAL